MGMLRPRRIDELNPYFVKNKPVWTLATLNAATMMEEMYGRSNMHPHCISDCLLAKLNLLGKGRRVRKNPRFT